VTRAFSRAFNDEHEKHYSLDSGVVIDSDIETKVSTIADAYHAAAEAGIEITSGTRTAAKQANAMYAKFQLGGDSEVALYVNATAAQEIYSVYSSGIAAGNSQAATVEAMATVINTQISAGTYISKHLKAGAVDVRSSNMSAQQKDHFRTAAESTATSVVLETNPPHWHLQF